MPRKIKASNIATGAVTSAILDNSGVTAGNYGSSTAIPVLTVNAKGQVTVASTASLPANLATETYVSTAISNLVNAAPATLDTLNELAAALGNDANYASTITTALGTKANTSSLGPLATLSPTGTANASTFLAGDGSYKTVSVTPTAISDQNNTSTGYFDLPAGTTAQRPASPLVGMIRYNTTLGFAEQYTSDGWQGIAPSPTITSVSPTSYNGEQGTTITINGTSFDNTVTVKFITAQGFEYSASSTRISSSQLTAITPQDFTVANEPLKVKVLNGSGLSYVLDAALDCGVLPTWSTASGTIATQFTTKAVSTSIAAIDTDGGSTVSYSIASGSLPSGVFLNSSTGAITGTISASAGTYTFTARVTDNAGNTADRSFSIVVTDLPSGGSITTSGNFRIHTFNSSSTFVNTVPNLVCQYVIVGGGGSGGVGNGNNDCGGGGGGAGGYISSVSGESSGGGCGTASTITASVTSYSVTIGAGGGARVGGGNAGYNGGDSSVFGITAYGGGGGSTRDSTAGSGGSGGGGSCTGYNGSGTSCQGYRGGGGAGTPGGGTYGGGGAGGYTAGTPSGGTGSAGGSGVNSSITGSSVGYAGGGGGGGGQSTGGSASHGGGAGGNSPRGTGGSGTANTGGGGGGAGGWADGSTTSGAGGSGIVVIRYDVTTF